MIITTNQTSRATRTRQSVSTQENMLYRLGQHLQGRRLLRTSLLTSARTANATRGTLGSAQAQHQQHQEQLSWQQQQRRNVSKVSALSLTSKKRHGHKISMISCYDYPSAVHVARAGIDVILIGDSVAMVELGHQTTQPMTMDEMLHHCASVKRGVDYAAASASAVAAKQRDESSSTTPTCCTTIPLLVGDMPFGSYEYEDTDIALRNAYRFVKEAGVDCVKLEVCLH
jgi:Ketopantoate hydroxymethyltransferase